MRRLFMLLCAGFCCILATIPAAHALPSAPLLAPQPEAHGVRLREGPALHLYGLVIPDADRLATSSVWQDWQSRPLRVTSHGVNRYGIAWATLQDAQTHVSFNEALVEGGLALVYPSDAAPIPEPLWQAEHRARAAARGYWAQPHAVLDANATDIMAGKIGQFVVAQGRVQNMFASRAARYWHFGTDWRRDMSLRFPRRLWKACAAWLDAAPVAVEFRGQVTEERGPLLLLHHPDQLRPVLMLEPALNHPNNPPHQ